jgi:hypothetical protein
MSHLQQTLKSPRTWLAAGVYIASAGVGLVWGYDFGFSVGGQLGGVLTGCCGAIFCTLLADSLASRLVKRQPR